MVNHARHDRRSPSVFGAEQRIGKPLSALAVQTGAFHRRKQHARPKMFGAKAYRQEMSGPTRSGSAMKSTVYNSRKPQSLITLANSHNILCKIGAAKTRTRVDKAAPGVHDDTARVRILTESDIIFCHHVTFYSSSDWSRARLFAKA